MKRKLTLFIISFGRMIWRIFSRLLDHKGGRFILAKTATIISGKMSGVDTEVFYDVFWIHRVEKDFFPDGHEFNYSFSTFANWKGQADRYFNSAEDYWFRYYTPNDGDVIFDIGAGRGEDTFVFSKVVGEAGRVFAVEAYPKTFEILEKFCSLNGLNNTTLLQLALMDKKGFISMSEDVSWEKNAISFLPGIQVQADTLDNICIAEGINNISFLKMNIEGAERFALLGMDLTIKRVNSVCIACHDFLADRGGDESKRTCDFVKKYLKNHGFKVYIHDDDPRDYVRNHVFGLKEL